MLVDRERRGVIGATGYAAAHTHPLKYAASLYCAQTCIGFFAIV